MIEIEGRTPQQILDDIRAERDWYMSTYNLTPDDLWILMDWDVQMDILKNCERIPEGPDCMTRSKMLGMHLLDYKVKKAYVIPKHRPPRDDSNPKNISKIPKKILDKFT